MKKSQLMNAVDIRQRIFTIRNAQVMIDADLAELYQVDTKVLNQAIKRNIDRFPENFRFQLSNDEKKELVTYCDRLEKLKHSSVRPHAFTEQGVAMLSAVLRSDIAVNVSIQIMNAFVGMRKFISSNALLFQRLIKVETKQIYTDSKIDKIFEALEGKEIQPTQGIFYAGQVFDAYQFVSKLIHSAKQSIVLIDNYIGESVLTHFSKKKKNVALTFFTKTVTKQMLLDVKKFNQQYPYAEIIQFQDAHDRFLIIDRNIIYHFGASLKDLGKKWFAFSRMDISAIEMLFKLEERPYDSERID